MFFIFSQIPLQTDSDIEMQSAKVKSYKCGLEKLDENNAGKYYCKFKKSVM